MNSTALILPGIGNSSPNHWQSHWQRTKPGFARIQHVDWENPICSEWVKTLEKTLSVMDDDVVLVAHSLGCALVAHWAGTTNLQVKGALLVAPPDPDGSSFPTQASGFAALPMDRFAFPSVVIASSNDPYSSLKFAESMAISWGSRFVNIGEAGHINADSGFGVWSDGFRMFQQLVI